MGRNKEPIDLIVAKGKKHLSKAEIQERKEKELDVPFKNIIIPEYLSDKQKEKFREIASKLLVINIYTELDIDVLARYILAQDLYLLYTSKISKIIKKGDVDLLEKYQRMQDKAFSQAQSCARELGLTISSRCRIEVPYKEPETKRNKFDKFRGVGS